MTNDACSAVRCVSHFDNVIYLYSTRSKVHGIMLCSHITKCRDKTSYVIKLETKYVSRRHFRDILRHCPAKYSYLTLTLPGASLGHHLLFCTLLGPLWSVLLDPKHTNDGQWCSECVVNFWKKKNQMIVSLCCIFSDLFCASKWRHLRFFALLQKHRYYFDAAKHIHQG